MYVLDSGTVNRKYEDIAAVGFAGSGKLQLALLISRQWDGEEVQFRNQLDAMMSTAELQAAFAMTFPVLSLTTPCMPPVAF